MEHRRDWKKIKAEYIGGKPREEICKDHKIPYNTLNTRISKGKWAVKKKDAEIKIEQKAIEKAIESLAEKQAKTILQQEEHSEFIIEEIIKAYKQNPDQQGFVKILADTLEKAYKLKRQAVGLKDETDLNLIMKKPEKTYTDEELKEELKKRKIPVLDLDQI